MRCDTLMTLWDKYPKQCSNSSSAKQLLVLLSLPLPYGTFMPICPCGLDEFGSNFNAGADELVQIREEKCSSQQINSLEWQRTTAQRKVCSISLNRSLFCSSLGEESKLSEHQQPGSRDRFCPTVLPDIKEVDKEWRRAVEVRKEHRDG